MNRGDAIIQGGMGRKC